VISLAIYYLPSFKLLEISTASHSSKLLRALGFDSRSYMLDSRAIVDGFEIEKDCTGVQVFALLAGLVLPVPLISVRRKLLLLSATAVAIYVLNVVRIALQIWLYYGNILPWTSVHDSFGRVLAAFSVFALILVTAKIFPEYEQFLLRIFSVIRESLALPRPPPEKH